MPRDKGAVAGGEKGKDKRQKVTTSCEPSRMIFKAKGKRRMRSSEGREWAGRGQEEAP